MVIVDERHLEKMAQRSKAQLVRAVLIHVIAIVILAAVWAGVKDEYDRAGLEMEKANARAKSAEMQVDLMLKNGDCGIALANISPDIGPVQLRIVPAQYGILK